MHPDLEKLLDLQAKDLALVEADAALLEIGAAEAALDEGLRKAERELEQARRAAADARARRDEMQRRIDGYRTQQSRRQQRLDQVRNAREATAVMAELDLAKSVLQREETDWIRQADEVARLEARVAEAERQFAEVEGRLAGDRAALATRRLEAEAVRAEAAGRREESAGRLDPALRKRYDRLLTSRTRRTLAPLKGFSCSACFSAVPVSRRAQIRGGLLLEGCEVCGVILYQPESAG